MLWTYILHYGRGSARALLDPRQLYLTPGLWERQGDTFFRAFWFETPFALMRGLFLWGPAFLLVFSVVCLMRARKLASAEAKGSLADVR